MNSRIIRVGLTTLLVIGLGTTAMASQTVPLKQLMRQKLDLSEKLLEAVVTSNWLELGRRSRSLEQLTNDPAWAVLNMPEFGRRSAAFAQAARDLVEAAEKRDEEATPLAYLSLTLSCVRCHQYVSRIRIADLAGPQSSSPRAGPTARRGDR